jgi:hypothetical protein
MTVGTASCEKISAQPQAAVALILSQALPRRVRTFDYIDGIWGAIK